MSTGSSRQVLGAVVVVLALGLLGIVGYLHRRGGESRPGLTVVGQGGPSPTGPATVPPRPPAAPTYRAAAPPEPSEVVVHVAGAVRKPGVYRLKPGARVDDAVKAAGGATEKANVDAVNLAEKLEDGRQLYVPTRTVAPPGTSAGDTFGLKPVGRAGATGRSGRGGSSASAPAKLRTPGEGTVNVNTAGPDELQRLPGVGPSYAARIVQYRKENGPFASPDDLMNVSGIGPKKMDAMRPFVRVK